jgi:hypothetical protein
VVYAVYMYFCGLCCTVYVAPISAVKGGSPLWVCVSLVLMKSFSSRGVEFASCWFYCLHVTNIFSFNIMSVVIADRRYIRHYSYQYF